MGGAIISESGGGIIPLQGGGIIPELGGGFLTNQHSDEVRSAPRDSARATGASQTIRHSSAVWSSVYMTAARSAPRSEPPKSRDFPPKVRPRDAPIFEEAGEGRPTVSRYSMALATPLCRESLARSACSHSSSVGTRSALLKRRGENRAFVVGAFRDHPQTFGKLRLRPSREQATPFHDE